MNTFKTSRLLFAIGTSLLFIMLGYHLIQKEDNFPVIAGYANIIFFSIILLLAFAKLFQQIISNKPKQK